MGRPSGYSEELVDQICERLCKGHSLVEICDTKGMPSLSSVWRWMHEHDEFRNKYARAREVQAEVMDHKVQATADACTVATAAADRVKIDAYKWRAGHLSPKRFRDTKVAVVGGDETDAPIKGTMRVIEEVVVRHERLTE